MDDNLVIVHQSALLHVLRRIWIRVVDYPAFSPDAQGSEPMLESENHFVLCLSDQVHYSQDYLLL